ncbi:MAG: cell wall-active antibiotics response protein [Bacteroidetes bacterium]|jgi:predicted membrane protein|nr:cell wall-active antibiotics response protein [Bacteroidota bacterium]
MNKPRISAQLVFGLVVLAVGVILTLDNMNLIYAEDYLRWWPALLMIYGLARLLDPDCNRFWSIFWIAAGGVLLLDKLEIIFITVRDWWPVVLIALGGSVLWGSLRKSPGQTAILTGSEGSSDDTVVNLTAVMGGFERRNSSRDFRGGKITTIMGGCELDLRQADIRDTAVIEVFAIWGGISLKVPETWSVRLEGMPIMGGFSDETRPVAGATKRLIIRGSVVMGGVEIKN